MSCAEGGEFTDGGFDVGLGDLGEDCLEVRIGELLLEGFADCGQRPLGGVGEDVGGGGWLDGG